VLQVCRIELDAVSIALFAEQGSRSKLNAHHRDACMKLRNSDVCVTRHGHARPSRAAIVSRKDCGAMGIARVRMIQTCYCLFASGKTQPSKARRLPSRLASCEMAQ
jgi:hypothetical protein